jgi:hypothetical protein
MTTTLQIPLDKAVLNEAKLVAQEDGHGSLQEVVRLFLHRYAKRHFRMDLVHQDKDYMMSSEYEKYLDNISRELDQEIKNGTALKATSADEMVSMLNKKK